MRLVRPLLLSAALLAAAGGAEAHTGTHGAAFAQGLAHPFGGLDHVLAMVAVGLWAAQLGGRALWAVPATFVAMVAVGGALAMAGMGLAHVELGIAVSLLALGALIAARAQPGLAAAVAVTGVFALFHGHAHGAELPASTSALGYAIGFVVATALLHLAGIGVGLSFRRGVWLRAGGAAIAAAGMVLAVV
jgi:urease accessory protein